MIEKVNANSACFHRLYTTKIGQKSRIGHVFKHNVYNAIFDMKKCPFAPEVNESSKKKGHVFKNSERLYNDGQRWVNNRESRKKEENDHFFKPKTTEYYFRDLWEKPGKGERLGLDLSSRKTKYYDEEKFSPYRFKKAYLRGDFDEFYDLGDEGFRPQEKLNIVLHELPEMENGGPIDDDDTVLNRSFRAGGSPGKKVPRSALKSTRDFLTGFEDEGVTDEQVKEQLKELNNLKKKKGGKSSSRKSSRKKSKISSRKKSKKNSKAGSRLKTPVRRSTKQSKKISKSVTPKNEKKVKGKKKKKRKGKKKKKGKLDRGISFTAEIKEVYKKKEPKLLYVNKEKVNYVNNIPKSGDERFFLNIVNGYAVEKEGGLNEVEGEAKKRRRRKRRKKKEEKFNFLNVFK